MKTFIDIDINKPDRQINYRDGVMLVGSCFTEHIGGRLDELKFNVFQNPSGIIFDPSTIATPLVSYIDNHEVGANGLFFYNEVWQSWQHHGRISDVDQYRLLTRINEVQHAAHHFLQSARWLVITLGTSFSYRLIDGQMPVANCHRAPNSWFTKHLMSIDEMIAALDLSLYRLFRFNPDINVIFTVSPVRHIRDGIVHNNRSKARLLEAVHHLVEKFSKLYYFPSYELVIDVLRDYRYYDVDLVHPNYAATTYVIENFLKYFVDEESVLLAEKIGKLVVARRHKPFHPTTTAHQRFIRLHAEKTKQLIETYPFLDLEEELQYFSQTDI